jgi:hypothetical protein
MAIITKSIGTSSRDYSTLAAWAASLPANLVTDGNSYVGECYKDSEFFGSTTLLTLAGHTTDATHTITLTTGAGQSFRDNANIQTNGLRYNAANGVAIRSDANTSGVTVVQVDDNNVTLSNLQISGTVWCRSTLFQNSASNFNCNNCIISWEGVHYTFGTVDAGVGGTYRNCLMVDVGLIASNAVFNDGQHNINGGAALHSCDLVTPSDGVKPTQGLKTGYGSPVLNNCAIFGQTASYFHTSGSGAPVFTTCMTDQSGTTGLTGGKTYAQLDQEDGHSPTGWLKTGADLLSRGTVDTTNSPTDIAKTTRPQGSARISAVKPLLAAAARPRTCPRRVTPTTAGSTAFPTSDDPRWYQATRSAALVGRAFPSSRSLLSKSINGGTTATTIIGSCSSSSSMTMT